MYQLSSDAQFSFTFAEVLSLAHGGGSTTGEVLRAASQVVPSNYESWYTEFRYLGDQLTLMANTIDPEKFPVSARETYFRAASYYRMMDFYLHGNASDPRINESWELQIPLYDKALSLLDVPAKRYNISAHNGNFTIPVIFYPASNDPSCKRPTILAGSGYDGTQEELYHGVGIEVLARGFNFVTYEGPGQPTVRRQQGLGFIPNWWDAVTPVVDFLATKSNVDMDQLALMGVSFGGTLAPLATTHEKRFKATIAIDGLVSIYDAIQNSLSGVPELAALLNSTNATLVDSVFRGIQSNPQYPTTLRWLIDQGLWSFTTDSPYEWLTRLKAISLHNVTDQIPGPLFDGRGQDDNQTMGQPQLLKADLGDRATYHDFRTDLGAGEHCQLGNEPMLMQAVMDWLMGVFQQAKGNNTVTV